MKNIILVGAGQLGCRHLQALALLMTRFKIYVLDPSAESLERANKLFKQVESGAEHDLYYVSDLDDIRETDFDYAIIATSSNVRFTVLKNLLERFEIQNILFEKILFQELEHYHQAGSLLADRGVSAWVNCPRRMYEFYQLLKRDYLGHDMPVRFEFVGNEQVGLACNAIHYLDILNYLSDQPLSRVQTSRLNSQIIESKRHGFVEFTGELVCEFADGSLLTFNAIKGGSQPSKSRISQGDFELRLDETNGDYEINCRGNTDYHGIMKVPFQSRLTNRVIEQIETSGGCSLADFTTSASLHVPYIAALLEFYNVTKRLHQHNLPIT